MGEIRTLDEVQQPEIILLASTSKAKITPTQESAIEVFDNAQVIAVKSESRVSDNPFLATETLKGALNRWESIADCIEAEAANQILAIESGILATYGISADEFFTMQLKGRVTPEMVGDSINLPQDLKIMKVNAVTGESKEIAVSESPLNAADTQLHADDPNALYLDRAIVVTYDKRTDTTFIGISRGVACPPEAVKEAIIDNGGKERVSEAMKRTLIKNGTLADDGTILKGPLAGQKFDVQDPQNFLTDGKLPRSLQLTEIEKAVFEAVNRERLMQEGPSH